MQELNKFYHPNKFDLMRHKQLFTHCPAAQQCFCISSIW